ncbi:hypothetical protein PTSG_09376 [Salpingoeca rosetta]|uniref:Uncharacterized protein n=1 Tax=Salpingoeca rosetta (strain ATCC 50818 / BSB-021) TaxID=946362 RepID=F2UMG0_SALR5|nr:uncharacterized protein PTSG_09376 [Salpingoeca rosetta]EGD78309.1 hypothetical protein PTSG_09376 [Salpingoeca rosetta]|eukprot:XP_004989632.1 hypothetical protein PTSG_09376 [Salpingoeca rosetta]
MEARRRKMNRCRRVCAGTLAAVVLMLISSIGVLPANSAASTPESLTHVNAAHDRNRRVLELPTLSGLGASWTNLAGSPFILLSWGTLPENVIITGFVVHVQPLAPQPTTWAYGQATFDVAVLNADTDTSDYALPSALTVPFVSHNIAVAINTTLGMGPDATIQVNPAFTVPSGQPRSVGVALPPEDPTTYPQASDALLVSWTVPADLWFSATPIRAFDITATPTVSGSGPIVSAQVQVTWALETSGDEEVFEHVITALQPATTYKVRVYAVGLEGARSISSAAKLGTTREDVPDAAPTGLTINSVSTSTMELSWNEMDVSTPGSNGEIIGYSIHETVVGDGCETNTCAPAGPCQETPTCSFGECMYTDKPNYAACDDGDSSTIHDRCIDGVCVGRGVGVHVTEQPVARQTSIAPFSTMGGGGFMPHLNEFWLLDGLKADKIHRFARDGAHRGEIALTNTSLSWPRQLWGEFDTAEFFTAEPDAGAFVRRGPYPSLEEAWRISGVAVRGIAADDTNVYYMKANSTQVVVMRKADKLVLGIIFLSGGIVSDVATFYSQLNSGLLAVVRDKLYLASGRALYRYNLADGVFDGFILRTDVNTLIPSVSFTGRDICVTSDFDANIFCYQVISHNIWTADETPHLLDIVDASTTHTLQARTSVVGGGFNPWANEFWYPGYCGTTVQRMNVHGDVLGSFTPVAFAGCVVQLWSDFASETYYLASNTQILKATWPDHELVWSYAMPSGVGGVTADGASVYAMGVAGDIVYVLSAVDGSLQQTLQLSGAGGDAFGFLLGGLVAINGKLYRGDALDNTFYRYDLSSGAYDNLKFTVPHPIYTTSFQGRDICVSSGNSTTVHCYPILSDNVYFPSAFGSPSLVVGSAILDDSNNKALSALLPNRYFHRCYSGSAHGFSAATFHAQCDDKGVTLVVARHTRTGRVFGGFTSLSWSASGDTYQLDPYAFLFTIVNGSAYRTDTQLQEGTAAIRTESSLCPSFGDDLVLGADCQTGTATVDSFSITTGAYTNTWLAGDSNISLSNIEVFYQTADAFDLCDNVQCAELECAAENTCLFGVCTPVDEPDGLPCDDSDSTTAFDACVSGKCVGAAHHSTSPSYTLANLRAGYAYTVQVKAHTAIGSGPPSSSVAAVATTTTTPVPTTTTAPKKSKCSCPSEVLNGVTWPAVVGCNAVSSVQCPSTSRPLVATRTCTKLNVLGAVNSTACRNDRLLELATEALSPTNVAQVATSLSQETTTTEFMGAEDVKAVVNVIGSVSRVLNASLSEESVRNITTSLTSTISNMLAAPSAALKSAEANITSSGSSASLPSAFATALGSISRALPANSSFIIEQQNVKVAAFNYGTSQSRVVFPPTVDSADSYWDDDDSTASGSGSGSTESRLELSPATPTSYFSFAVYASPRLFLSEETVEEETAELQQKRRDKGLPFISSQVILAQADSDTHQPFNGTIRFRVNKTEAPAEGDDDACVFWQFDGDDTSSGSWQGTGCARTNTTGLPPSVVECECTHLTNFATLTSPKPLSSTNKLALDIITIGGVVVSVPSMLLTVAVFAWYRKLRTIGRIITMHLCINLSTALLLLVLGTGGGQGKSQCTAVAASLHYFLLTSFTWMLIEGIHLYKTFVVVFDNGKTDAAKHASYAAIAYGVPALIVACSGGALGADEYVNYDVCWLKWSSGAIWAFIAPLVVVVFLNIVFFVRILRSVLGVGMTNSDSRKRAMLIRSAKVSASFFCVMGITWVFGVVAISGSLETQYLFAILNAFQGLFIFVFHCVRDKTVQATVRGKREQFHSHMTRASKKLPSSMKTTQELNWRSGRNGTMPHTSSLISVQEMNEIPSSMASTQVEEFPSSIASRSPTSEREELVVENASQASDLSRRESREFVEAVFGKNSVK